MSSSRKSEFSPAKGFIIAIVLFCFTILAAMVTTGMDNIYTQQLQTSIPLAFKIKSYAIILMLYSAMILFIYSFINMVWRALRQKV